MGRAKLIMARVLLVNPPFYRIMGSHYNGISLGIAYIAAVLNKEGHDAWTYNADYLNSQEYLRARNFRHTMEYQTIFDDPDHEIWNEVAQCITTFEPDWVGYTGYTANLKAIQILSSKVHRLLPSVRQLVGGVLSTLDPDLLRKLPDVDVAIRGEGEYTTLALVNESPPETLPGVSWNRDFSGNLGGNKYARSPAIRELDQLPFPERNKLWGISKSFQAEEGSGVDASYIITTRGCPFRCSFCASPNIWGRTNINFRSTSNIVDEMRYLKENFWITQHIDYGMLSANSSSKSLLLKRSLSIVDNTIVYFVDDVFTLKPSRTKSLLRGIIDSGLDMPWKCESRADRIDDEMATLMAEAGCKRVKLGFESGSDRILRQITKDETKEEMFRGVRCLKRAGIPITAYFMAGFPGETDDDLRETIDFARSIEADFYSLSILAPYHGTQISYDLNTVGKSPLDKEPWEHFFHQTRELLVNSSLSDSVLEEFWKLSDIGNYV
jgi:anaerobic magnesium-protoporphyrin IX monomethyl ester cyclase